MENIEYLKIIENLTIIKEDVEDENIKLIIQKIIDEITLFNNKMIENFNCEDEFENKLKLHSIMVIKKELYKNSFAIKDLYSRVLKDFDSVALNEMESKVFEMIYLFFLTNINDKEFIINEVCETLGINEIEYLQHALSLSVKQAVYFKKTKIDILTRNLTKDKKLN